MTKANPKHDPSSDLLTSSSVTCLPNIDAAQKAINMIGRKFRPAHGTETWAFANGKPLDGIVIDVYMPDIKHPYVVFKTVYNKTLMYPFELDAITDSTPPSSPKNTEVA